MASNSGYEVNHSPPPERSQCSRVGPQVPLTTTGTRSTQASSTTRENDSSAEGETATRASWTMSHLSGLVHHPGDHDVGVRVELDRDRADQGQGQRAGVPLLVGGEVLGQHLGALVLVHPAHADDVGTVAQAEHVAARPAGPGGLTHARARARSGASRPPGRSARPAGARPRCGSRRHRRRRRCPGRPGDRGAGSSWAAGCSTAGIGTRPMAATVGWYRYG